MKCKILYISSLSSNRVISEIYKSSSKNPGFAIQKFSRLLAQGFVENGVQVEVLSTIPIEGDYNKVAYEKQEIENSIKFHYIPFLNIPIIKHICICFYTLFYVLIWGVKNRKEGYVVFDVLKISMSIAGLCASKIARLKTVGLVTDMPGLMVGTEGKIFSKLIASINRAYLKSFSCYVFLTEQMNAVINTKNRPYIVMEGLVDVNLPSASTSIPKSNPKTMLYAGGLHERYGLKMLVDAFVNLNRNDWQLVIYGNGPYEKELRTIAENNQNVIYRGVAPNEEVVEAEYRASLLVNPRPTTEEFTKYSFPSKNMEYMVSGTPLLTTKLPGMPKEYWEYVYLFDEETTEGYQCKFEEIFSLSDAELSAKGALAQEFVINRKNNTIQADRILQMLNTL